MARVVVRSDKGTRCGWFDPSKAQRFDEATYWNGSNNVSKATGSQWDHQALYRTAGGRWVLRCWSRRQSEGDPSYTYVDDERAKIWLLENGEEQAAERYFDVEEERGPGRPAVGPMVNVRLGEDLTARVDAARLEGESRAAAIRRLLEDALS